MSGEQMRRRWGSLSSTALSVHLAVYIVHLSKKLCWPTSANLRPKQWRRERYDGTSTRTGPLQSKKIKIELKDNAKNE